MSPTQFDMMSWRERGDHYRASWAPGTEHWVKVRVNALRVTEGEDLLFVTALVFECEREYKVPCRGASLACVIHSFRIDRLLSGVCGWVFKWRLLTRSVLLSWMNAAVSHRLHGLPSAARALCVRCGL